MDNSFNPGDYNITPETWDNATRFSSDQKKDELQSIIKENYPVIKAHFNDKRGSIVTDQDIDDICGANMWHWVRMYELGHKFNGKNMAEVFQSVRKDFDHRNKEIVINMLRERRPENYVAQCAFVLNMSEKEVIDFVEYLDFMYYK